MGTTWTMERMPQKESIKNGRFNVVVDLIYELTFTSFYPQAQIESQAVLGAVGGQAVVTVDGKAVVLL